MDMVWTVIGVFVILAGLWLLYGAAWALLEAIHPFCYRRVSFAELREHIGQEYNRGVRGSQMVISDEATGRILRVCKDYEAGDSHVKILLVAEVTSLPRDAIREVIGCLRKDRIQCFLGHAGSGWHHGAVTLTCRGGDSLDGVFALAERMLLQVCGASRDSTFRVYVRGNIGWLDMHVSGTTTPMEVWAISYQVGGAAGKPYKWSHCMKWNDLGKIPGQMVRGIVLLLRGGRHS
jgi:hypothetical protein